MWLSFLSMPSVDGLSSAVRHTETMVRLRPPRAPQGRYGPLPPQPRRGLPASIVGLLEQQ
jgi:allantoin racemase